MDEAGSIAMRRVASAEAFGEGLAQWRGVLRVGGWGALASVGLTFVQVWIYIQWPPPETVEGFYALLAERPVLGLLSLDLLYIVNNTIVLLVYLAVFTVLRRIHPSTVTIGLLMGAVGMAAYMASNTGFEMLALADAYATADATGQLALVGAGEAMLAVFEGTAFDIYYILSAIALFLFAGSMLRSRLFSRATGAWGLAAAVLMVVPSTAGTVGMVFALGSLLPWVVFALFTGRQLLQLGSTGGRIGNRRMSLSSYTVETTIARPPVEVFEFCSDLRNEQVWNPTSEYVEKLTPGPVGLGTRYAAKWSNTGRIIVEVVGFDPPNRWETRSRAGGLIVTVQGKVSDFAPGTRYETAVKVDARGLAKLYAPLAVIAMRRREPRNLLHLGNTLEAGATRDARG